MNPCSFFIVVASLLNFSVSSTEVTIKKSKSEIKVNGTTNNSNNKSGVSVNSDQQFVARARQYFISNRDSYVNAASSFESDHHVMTSYQVPQNSYNAPSSKGYAHHNQGGYEMKSGYGGGWGWADNSQSSKGDGADLLGLIGLIGLKGLTGTIPIIKKAILVFIALLPILIPLAIIKLPILLLKPVFTFGRGSSTFDKILRSADQISKTLEFVEKFNETLTNKVTDDNSNWMINQDALHSKITDNGIVFGNDIIGKDADNRCMQRIACEGLFKSLPRILFRLIGESTYILRRQRDNNRLDKDEKDIVLKVDAPGRARRKDLATLAVNKLKNSQYLTKSQPITDDIIKTEDVCKQYKCSELF